MAKRQHCTQQHNQPAKICHPQTGFSLIEVLVSFVVLSFGILGAVKMQLDALQSTQQSHYMTLATALANEMAEKIRSHSAELSTSDSSNPFLAINYDSSKDHPRSDRACFNQHCTTQELANSEINEWLVHIDSVLPNVHAVVCEEQAPWNPSTNHYNWECGNDKSASIVIKLGWSNKTDPETGSGSIHIPTPTFAMVVHP